MQMKRKISLIMLIVAGAGLLFAAWSYLNDRGRLTTAPEFTGLKGQFSNGIFYSPADPEAEILIIPEYEYVGGQKFILYGTADVEQHFFVKADDDRLVTSAFLLQFESVRPGVDWQYDYSSSPLRLQIGEFNFFTDIDPRSTNPIFKNGKPGSDFNMERKFLTGKGYHFPKNYIWARLVHLPTTDRRKELLIIFTEDLAPTGLTRSDLEPGGDHEGTWTDRSHAHLEKLKRAITIRRPE